jgi:PEP-CTERM motif-containing protein
MRRSLSIALLGAVGLLLPTKACADMVRVTAASYGPGVFNPMSIQPFDPALGTLNSVNVTLQGQINATVVQLPCGEQSTFLCPFELVVDQDFFGLSPAFFSFGTDAQFVFEGTDPTLIQNYIYTFTFDAFTDTIFNGFTFPNFSSSVGGNATQIIPPADINGRRANFLPTIVGFNEVDDVLTVGVSGADVTSYSDAGALIVQYNYTPVPEPSSLFLLASGLSALILRRRIERLSRAH